MAEVDLWVDGSYMGSKKSGGWGFLAVRKNRISVQMYGPIKNPSLLKYRNVSGEILATVFALNWAKDNGYSSVRVFHDYNGIKEWALGNWQRKNELTKSYYSWYQEISKEIKIRFVQVKGHSDLPYNDHADHLAKLGATTEHKCNVVKEIDLKCSVFLESLNTYEI